MGMVGAFFGWWYGRGWQRQLRVVSQRLLRWADYFSFSIITRTLFAPFRQIGAEQSGGGLDVQLHQWMDRTFSRGVGFVVRLGTLVFGACCMSLIVLGSMLQLAGWLLLPIMPILGVVLCAVRWLPWQS
jgi:hypothetical protein